MKAVKRTILAFGLLGGIYLVWTPAASSARAVFVTQWLETYPDHNHSKTSKSFSEKLVAAARARTLENITYDPAYVSISYPGGDVPADTGVCSDVIVRSYRTLGIDLQQLVHEDMQAHFEKYPRIWNLSAPDSNIDHRRVPNLMTFFRRHGSTLPRSKNAKDYAPGDLVTWDFGNGLTHIGIISDKVSKSETRPYIIHNAGAGPKEEDRLFEWPIIGHFRYQPTELQ